MKEAEVSLRVAIEYIKSGQTEKDVRVAIDGAQIKTEDRIHFQITDFMKDIGFEKDVYVSDTWQGRYTLEGYEAGIVVHSKSGEGDVVISLINGRTLFIESKGFSIEGEKGSGEYPKMREAIGQLMTCTIYSETVDYAIAIPDSVKSRKLTMAWSEFTQIKKMNIKFFLVSRNKGISIL